MGVVLAHQLAVVLSRTGLSPLKAAVIGFFIVEVLLLFVGIVLRIWENEPNLVMALIFMYIVMPAAVASKCYREAKLASQSDMTGRESQ